MISCKLCEYIERFSQENWNKNISGKAGRLRLPLNCYLNITYYIENSDSLSLSPTLLNILISNLLTCKEFADEEQLPLERLKSVNSSVYTTTCRGHGLEIYIKHLPLVERGLYQVTCTP